jgi:creatinine amidohydrolase
MRLEHATWEEVDDYLGRGDGVLLPAGSTEQHGPFGLIGTDTICARTIAERAGEMAGALVAPALAYTPAPFNLAFPGSVSVSVETFSRLVGEILDSLSGQGFRHFYVLNGHGANRAPLESVAAARVDIQVRVRSWWDFPEVDGLRKQLYGDWEGMHATPSEVAITQANVRIVERADMPPPEQLSADYMKAHAGDKHGPPDEHRARFPDGRVGSHSALATPQAGEQLLRAAVKAVAADYASFMGQ